MRSAQPTPPASATLQPPLAALAALTAAGVLPALPLRGALRGMARVSWRAEAQQRPSGSNTRKKVSRQLKRPEDILR